MFVSKEMEFAATAKGFLLPSILEQKTKTLNTFSFSVHFLRIDQSQIT